MTFLKKSGVSKLDMAKLDEESNETSEATSNERKRDEWKSETEFLFSCLSLSVGLGNVWRFPFTAFKNGGGAFLIPYLVVLVVIGNPIYFLELAWGQFSSYGQVKIWNAAPLLKGVGYGELVASISGGSYYCAVMAVAIHYLIQSFNSVLPWSVCDEKWAYNCEAANQSLSHRDGAENPKSLTELYYENEVMKGKDQIFDGIGTPDLRLTLCLFAAWTLIFTTLIKGIKSSGKVAYFTALFPYFVLIILLIRGITLPGAMTGVKYFITPQWDKILDLNVWYAAVGQCFFSLSIGFGPTIMNASYNNFRHNIYRDAMIITIMDSLTSILSGFIVFAILGNLAFVGGIDVADVAKSGPGLVFVSYPEAISQFNFMPQFFSALFFLMLLALGIGTAFSGAGGIITVICDQFPNFKRFYATILVCTCGFLIGIIYVTPVQNFRCPHKSHIWLNGGSFLITLVDYFGASFVIYVMATLEVIGIAWVYGVSNFCQDIEFMLGIKVNLYWRICWGFLVPVTLIVILVYTLTTATVLTHNGVAFPTIAIACGWILSGIALAVIPVCAIHTIFTRKRSTFFKKLVDSIQPSEEWGPRNNQLRKEWQTSSLITSINYVSLCKERLA